MAFASLDILWQPGVEYLPFTYIPLKNLVLKTNDVIELA